MRIHRENAKPFLQALAMSLSKDPASLACWRILHIEHDNALSPHACEVMMQHWQAIYAEADCDVVPCGDGDMVLITRSLNHDELHALAHEFVDLASLQEGCVARYALYDLFRDWSYVRDLLTAKAGELNATETTVSTYSFGETAALEEVFDEAKKRRKVRMPLHVMVVEDDPLTCRVLTRAFQENYAVITASNAQEAVANYLLYAPDIVFLDIGLPDTNGFEVLHHIMATDSEAYVVMFSSSHHLDNVTAALSSGASGFVAKPFKKEKMRQYIQESALHHRKQGA